MAKETPLDFKAIKRSFDQKWAADKKTFIQYGIIGGTVLIFIVFLFIPILNRNQSLIEKIRSMKAQTQEANVKIARAPKMKEQKRLYESRASAVEKLFFARDETTKIIEIISTLATANGVQITALSPNQEHGKIDAPFDQSYSAVSYKLTVEGGYHAVGAFVNGIENYEKNMVLNEFQLKRAAQDSDVLEFSFILTAFAASAAGQK